MTQTKNKMLIQFSAFIFIGVLCLSACSINNNTKSNQNDVGSSQTQSETFLFMILFKKLAGKK